MILLDINVLLAAHRADHPHHLLVRPWLERLIEAKRPFTVPDTAWAGFVRIATSRRIFTIPTPIDDAFAFLRAMRAQPGHALIAPSEDHLALFERTCRDADAAGDLAADAYLAALAIGQDCALASLDRDFARFPGLRWIRPGEPS